jgi:brefeldin A-inhibited guanine nucleotide-exchange protein
VLSKITLTPVHLTIAQAAEHQAAIQAAHAAHTASVTSPTLSPTPSQASLHPPHSPIGSSPSSTDMIQPTPAQSTIHPNSSSSEYNLKIQSLQTLVMVLRSLVAWSQQGIAATIESTTPNDEAHTPTEESPRALTPNPGPGSRSTSQGETATRAQLIDDPEQFEALKYRKTALQDAIRKFNFKPKKVLASMIFAYIRELKHFYGAASSSQRNQVK